MNKGYQKRNLKNIFSYFRLFGVILFIVILVRVDLTAFKDVLTVTIIPLLLIKAFCITRKSP